MNSTKILRPDGWTPNEKKSVKAKKTNISNTLAASTTAAAMALGVGLTTLAPESVAQTISHTKDSIELTLDTHMEFHIPAEKWKKAKRQKMLKSDSETIYEIPMELKISTTLNMEWYSTSQRTHVAYSGEMATSDGYAILWNMVKFDKSGVILVSSLRKGKKGEETHGSMLAPVGSIASNNITIRITPEDQEARRKIEKKITYIRNNPIKYDQLLKIVRNLEDRRLLIQEFPIGTPPLTYPGTTETTDIALMLQSLGFEPKYQGNRRDEAGNITSNTEGITSPDALQNFKNLVATPGAESYAERIYRNFYSNRIGDAHALSMRKILRDRAEAKENLKQFQLGKKFPTTPNIFPAIPDAIPPVPLFNQQQKRWKFSTEMIPLGPKKAPVVSPKVPTVTAPTTVKTLPPVAPVTPLKTPTAKAPIPMPVPLKAAPVPVIPPPEIVSKKPVVVPLKVAPVPVVPPPQIASKTPAIVPPKTATVPAVAVPAKAAPVVVPSVSVKTPLVVPVATVPVKTLAPTQVKLPGIESKNGFTAKKNIAEALIDSPVAQAFLQLGRIELLAGNDRAFIYENSDYSNGVHALNDMLTRTGMSDVDKARYLSGAIEKLLNPDKEDKKRLIGTSVLKEIKRIVGEKKLPEGTERANMRKSLELAVLTLLISGDQKNIVFALELRNILKVPMTDEFLFEISEAVNQVKDRGFLSVDGVPGRFKTMSKLYKARAEKPAGK